MASPSEHRILVTGALGQLGTELVSALREKHGSENVVALDVRPTPDEKGNPSVQADILDRSGLSNIIEMWRIDEVYHLAAILSASGEANPVRCWDINMGGLLNVLELARRHSLRVFNPSSIAVFGPDVTDKAPQESPLHPTTMYGVTKVAGESMCEYYSSAHGVDVRGLRYPGLISWKAPPGGGTTDYAVEIYREAFEKGRYECFVSEHTRLPMMYIDDAIRASLELMEAQASDLRRTADYNLGAMSFSAGELAASIAERIEGFSISYAPDERQAYADSWPHDVDDAAARKDWGWMPVFDLEATTDAMLSNLLSNTTLTRQEGR